MLDYFYIEIVNAAISNQLFALVMRIPHYLCNLRWTRNWDWDIRWAWLTVVYYTSSMQGFKKILGDCSYLLLCKRVTNQTYQPLNGVLRVKLRPTCLRSDDWGQLVAGVTVASVQLGLLSAPLTVKLDLHTISACNIIRDGDCVLRSILLSASFDMSTHWWDLEVITKAVRLWKWALTNRWTRGQATEETAISTKLIVHFHKTWKNYWHWDHTATGASCLKATDTATSIS